MKKKNKRLRDWIPYLGILVGLIIVGYYPASEGYDAWRRSQVVSQVETRVEKQSDTRLEELWKQAEAWNARLAGKETDIPADQILPYEEQLSTSTGEQAFSSLMIPVIGLRVPVYHGTGESVLMAGAGHLENTSLPVGGTDTHTVISAHSGMANARGFDELDQVKIGDIFGIRVLGKTLAYKVSDIEVVLPEQMDRLEIQPGKDIATLITCTPYGINDHRLLVHGERTEVPDDYFDETTLPAAEVLKNKRNLPLALGLLQVVVLIVIHYIRKRKKQKRKQ